MDGWMDGLCMDYDVVLRLEKLTAETNAERSFTFFSTIFERSYAIIILNLLTPRKNIIGI